MFEKLGYKKSEYSILVEYRKERLGGIVCISFSKLSDLVKVSTGKGAGYLKPEDVIAIYQKEKELGWLK